MDRKTVKIIVGVASIAAFLIAIGLLCVALFAGMQTSAAVIMGIVAVLCFILAIEFGYLFLLNKSSKANYFLYDSAAKTNVPVQKLNFAVVNARTGR